MSLDEATNKTLDVLRYSHRPLEPIFSPKSVALIGASEREGSVGRTILRNLANNPFNGVIYPVNLKRNSVLGIKAYSSISEIPEVVDLAVVVTPAKTVPGVIKECVENGVKGSIIISAGFKEIGEKGVELERQIKQEAKKSGMRIIGPNCLGVMNTVSGLNATFAGAMALPGNVGFISQSGALCTSILDWSFKENVGFSAFVSTGSMLDVDWGDLIYYLGNDPKTKSIVIYMESIGDARSFLSAAREVSLTKPIIVIKPGRTEAAAKAAASHTGSLTGSDEVLDAAFRRVGVLRVDRIADLFNMAEILSKQSPPKGNRLTIITNAGGPGVLVTDSIIEGGGKLTQLSEDTINNLNEVLPPQWSHNNPIDILGDADPERYRKTLELTATDKETDGLMVILTPQAMTHPTQTAKSLRDYLEGNNFNRNSIPILASWMGGKEVAQGEEILNKAGVPTFAYPDTAARMFNYMWQYAADLKALYQTPVFPDKDEEPHDLERAKDIIEKVRLDNRTILTEYESKMVLDTYGIPTVNTILAQTTQEALKAAEKLGYPVVLKLNSKTITHKTDVGGVKLDLSSKEEVTKAFEEIQQSVSDKYSQEDFEGVSVQPMLDVESGLELIVGSSTDSQFGPVLLFGSGGTLVEVFQDRALGLPPLNTVLARRMMERTKIFHALKGVRGQDPVDLEELEKMMVRFSFLVSEQPWIKEIDINPLLASSEKIIALDARILLHEEKPKRVTAIRSYPHIYRKPWNLKNGTDVVIRPIRAEDELMIVDFHEGLSEESVYMRYFQTLKLDQRTAHERLTRICHIDYDREMALVAIDKSGEDKIIGVGRISRVYGSNQVEFAIVVQDAYQGQGLGSEILKTLVEIARKEGDISEVIGHILPENIGMHKVVKKLGFGITNDEGLLKASYKIAQ